ncbi:MAG: glycosyltransferase family 4 protein [Pseudomonadota bacterium]
MSQPEGAKNLPVRRVAHVTSEARFVGGVERLVYDVASGLAARGWPQALFHFSDTSDPEFLQPFEFSANSLAALDDFAPDVAYLHKVENEDAVRTLTERVPTVRMIHDHDVYCLRRHKYYPLSSRVCASPLGPSCYRHLCFIERNREGRLPVRLRRVSAQQQLMDANKAIGRFVAASRFMRAELAKNGFDPKKIDLIPPIPASLKDLRPQPLGDKREILFVGQLIRGKGVDLLLRALVKLEGEWRATIVGDGSHRPYCEQLACTLGIDARVRFEGRVSHESLDRFYANARVVAVPSRWPEPFGMVGIEAMARGRPVVAFDVGGISDWLASNETGFLIPEQDIDALASSLSILLSDRARAAAMGRRAAAVVHKQFRHEDCLDQTMQTLLEVA